jgi:thiamine-phosphate pyrophosphorylase
VLRYAISDGARFGRNAAARHAGLLAVAQRWARDAVDFVQLREKDLDGGELLSVAEALATIFREHGGRTRLLVNGRADIAVAAGAAGVHLTSRPGELTPQQVRRVFAAAGWPDPPISVSCHSVAEVERARNAGVDLILFGPVFEKRVAGTLVAAGEGLATLAAACRAAGDTPVLALGGVTERNSTACLSAGAAGVAAIRLYSC